MTPCLVPVRRPEDTHPHSKQLVPRLRRLTSPEPSARKEWNHVGRPRGHLWPRFLFQPGTLEPPPCVTVTMGSTGHPEVKTRTILPPCRETRSCSPGKRHSRDSGQPLCPLYNHHTAALPEAHCQPTLGSGASTARTMSAQHAQTSSKIPNRSLPPLFLKNQTK